VTGALARATRQSRCRESAVTLVARILTATALVAPAQCACADPAPVLPDAPGRELVEQKCAQCHSLDAVLRSHRTRKQWEAQLDAMLARGAKLSDEEFEQVAEYLASQLGPPEKE